MKNKKIILSLIYLTSFNSLFGHAGHESSVTNTSQGWMQWLGNFHYIFLHFPIVLIVMTVISEFLYWKSKNPDFDNASRFMLISAAILTIPTVITGFVFSYGVSYEREMEIIFRWHLFLGFFIAAFSFLTVILKELTIRKTIKTPMYYFFSLLILFVSINITGYLGGIMTFSAFRLLPF